MPENNVFTDEELELSAEIMSHIIRNAAMDVAFLKKPVFSLKLQPTEQVTSIGCDYEFLYYNPKWVIEKYSSVKNKLCNIVIHCILHSLYLHPSMVSSQDKMFDTVADFAVYCMMYSGDMLWSMKSVCNSIGSFIDTYSVTSTSELYELAQKDAKAFTKMYSVVSKIKEDDHAAWHIGKEEKQNMNGAPGSQGDCGEPGQGEPVKVDLKAGGGAGTEQEECWSKFLKDAKIGAKSAGYGSAHGNMFMEIKKPDRFSKFSYLEYIRRFARQEIVSEDPDTLDMMMYTWGLENLDDTPIVEFSEVREQCTPSDIIIAIDVSGSCSGEVAQNFLRQVYSLFEEMNLRSSVNIHVVTFDTDITSDKLIRSKADAEAVVRDYEPIGWGGTDFRCVFNYADKFAAKNRGKKLKGLYFFSDGEGAFPGEKPKYRTTFFIPETDNPFCQPMFNLIPDWVELVHYND